MDRKLLVQIGAIIFAALAITLAVIEHARRDDTTTAVPSPVIITEGHTDPHREKLVRCQQLGEAATRDAECLATWADNRRRFLGQPEGR